MRSETRDFADRDREGKFRIHFPPSVRVGVLRHTKRGLPKAFTFQTDASTHNGFSVLFSFSLGTKLTPLRFKKVGNTKGDCWLAVSSGTGHAPALFFSFCLSFSFFYFSLAVCSDIRRPRPRSRRRRSPRTENGKCGGREREGWFNVSATASQSSHRRNRRVKRSALPSIPPSHSLKRESRSSRTVMKDWTRLWGRGIHHRRATHYGLVGLGQGREGKGSLHRDRHRHSTVRTSERAKTLGPLPFIRLHCGIGV